MSDTPILDFVRGYAASNPLRLHMPGHKGAGPLGCEALDITEIDGAGGLYEADGPVERSRANASRLFGHRVYYSTEGCSHAIRAMLALACGEAGPGRRTLLAGRNAHRAFLSAAVLIGFDIRWLPPRPGEAYHSCSVDPARVEAALTELGEACAGVYLTSPDYMGHMADIAAIAEVCRRRGPRLLVDGAHGAYLHFLTPSRHPIALGADLCCDSAHKTLPVLTGGAYLHLSDGFSADDDNVREALALFGSSSPSWLILQSLDACNPVLERLPETLAGFLPGIADLKAALAAHGYRLTGDEPMKLTLCPRPFGYTGDALAEALADRGILAEFHDPDHLTLMPSPGNSPGELDRVKAALLSVPRRPPLSEEAPAFHMPEQALSPRAAAFAPRRTLPVEACEGRILAAPALSCPPCVPVAVCGERIDREVILRLRYYGIRRCQVVEARPERTGLSD
ncbi:MAG: amino acid decarboxylase [Clostridia bacterium]|nr:amino acid decarboxylase [Clostridia bacterium]